MQEQSYGPRCLFLIGRQNCWTQFLLHLQQMKMFLQRNWIVVMIPACHLAKVFHDKIKLFRHWHLWLDKVEQECSWHDGPAVQQGVVRLVWEWGYQWQSRLWGVLTIEIQGQLIEHAATRLLPNILVNKVTTKLIKTSSVGEGFGGGLKSEGSFHISKRVSTNN